LNHDAAGSSGSPRGGWDSAAHEGAGIGPEDVDIFNPYDGYAPMAQFFLEAFQWNGVKRGDAFAFYAGDIRVEGPHPLCSSDGNLGNVRTRTAMYTDSIEQLRGTAGARQVKVRAETSGGIHHAEQRRLDHVRQILELTACDTGDHHRAAITLSDVWCYCAANHDEFGYRLHSLT
jgi:hypothetical protein